MNTTNIPEPKSVELSNGGRAIILPNGDTAIINKGESCFIEYYDLVRITGELSQIINPPKPLQFPELPEGEEWSNPANLTPEQVEVSEGWRLLTLSEQKWRSENFDKLSDYREYECWSSERWQHGYNGNCEQFSYRTKAPLPIQKEKEEETHQEHVRFHAQEVHELIGKRHTAAFLRNCRVIVLYDPLYEYSPFQNDVIPEIILHRGVKEGHGEINPDMEYESHLDGKTYKLRNIISITV